MSDDNSGGTLRAVAWSEICPWLVLFRVFRIAAGFRVLGLATCGLFAMVVAWGFIGAVLGPSPQSDNARWISQYQRTGWVVTERVPDAPGLPACPYIESETTTAGPPIYDSIITVWLQLTEPLRRARGATTRELICLAFFGLSSLAIWAFIGGAITRIASVELSCGERIPMAAAMRHACTRFWSYFAAPLMPFMFLVGLGIPIAFLGLLTSFNFGVLLASPFWILGLLAGLVMSICLIGLIFGWPLMWGTISTEGTDAFDALSRSYAYVFQRPLHLLFYVAVATLLGALGWLFVWNLAALVVQATYWWAEWGCIGRGMDEVQALDGVGGVGFAVINFWVQGVKLLAVGFLYGYFWVAASAVYLLLRREVDATEMDEVYLEEDEGEETYGLPPLSTDSEGAPVVEDAPKTEKTPDDSAEKDAGQRTSDDETPKEEESKEEESKEEASKEDGDSEKQPSENESSEEDKAGEKDDKFDEK